MDGGTYSAVARPYNYAALLECRSNALAVRIRERYDPRRVSRVRRRQQIEAQLFYALAERGHERTQLRINAIHTDFEQEFDAPAQNVDRWKCGHAGHHPAGARLQRILRKAIWREHARDRVPPQSTRNEPVAHG